MGKQLSEHCVISDENDVALIEFDPEEGKIHAIRGLAWSYDDPPTNGGIVIYSLDEDEPLLDIDIISGGPDEIILDRGFGFYTQADEPLNIKLRAGGAGVVGKLTVIGYKRTTPAYSLGA